MSYFKYAFSYISLSIVGGIFTARVIDAFLQNIFLPAVDISILPDDFFKRLNISFDGNKQLIKFTSTKKQTIKYKFNFGIFLKELILWVLVISLLYLVAPPVDGINCKKN